MKKILLASLLAVTTNIASAQSVEISGFIREFVTSTKAGVAQQNITGITSDSPSSITFKASEDLGSGLKARVAIQTSVFADAPTTGPSTQLGNLTSTVGFANQYGSIDMGRQKHAYRLMYDNIDPFLIGTFSPLSYAHSLQGSRLNNAIYTQANLGPVTVKYDHGFSEVEGIGSSKVGSVAAKIAGVTATVAFYKDDSVAQNKGTSASLATTLPTKTEVAAIVTRDETATTTANAWSVVAKHPIGKFDVKAGYSYKDLGGINAYAVGAGYNFSKRTSVELIQTVANADTSANDVRITAVGINHRF